jgi:hypothetical protein
MENQNVIDLSVHSDLDNALKLFYSTPRRNQPLDLFTLYEVEKFRFEWCIQNRKTTDNRSREYLVKKYFQREDVPKKKKFDARG